MHLLLTVAALTVSVSVLSSLDKRNDSNSELLTTNAVRTSQERRLLEIFLFQRRSVEKYLVLQAPLFLEHFVQGSQEFSAVLDTVASLVGTPEENALVKQLRTLHARYTDGATAREEQFDNWKQERADLGERIVRTIQDLIHLGEIQAATDLETTGRTSFLTPKMLVGLFVGVFGLVLALLYFTVLRISRPLKQLSREMQRVSMGEFRRSLPLQGDKEVADVIRSFNQMTERLAELDERQADFLAQISHELRTPLTAIQEGSALLLEEVPGALTTPQRDIVQVVRNNSERLFRHLTAILDLARMEAKKIEYTFAPTDLLALTRRSVESLGLLARKKNQQITLHTGSPFPIFYIDGDRIQQVLDNLLNNAVKFTPERGEIHVFVSMQYDANSGERWAELRVRDSGIGVPFEDTERIFLKFYQGALGRWQSWRGSGLGLAISRHIVEAHGGRIWVESRPGEGATFIFTLPLRRERAREPRRETAIQRHRGRNVV